MASKESSTPSRSNGSYSYTKPVTEKSAGTKGDCVVGDSERVREKFDRRLGLLYRQRTTDSSSSTPLPPRKFKGQLRARYLDLLIIYLRLGCLEQFHHVAMPIIIMKH